ncbi:protein eiger [Microplitis mediator]|uniref:protein eiger n=1 Tax=Microplitis mediator TaxID=375433 RepID=UPI0025552BC3|nr:protein eiger [Microplitis mediator]
MTSTCKNIELNDKLKSNDSNKINVNKSITGEERKSFLNSRENLSISDIEQGFNKNLSCVRINKFIVLNVFTIVLVIIIIFIETFNLTRVINNKKEIDDLKQEFDLLRRQFYEENFLDRLMAFEEQLYDDEEMDDSDEQEQDDYTDYDTKIPTSTNTSTADDKFERALDALDKLEELKSKDLKKNYHDSVINKTTNKSNQVNKNQRAKRFISDELPVGYTKDDVPIFKSTFPRLKKNQTDYKNRKNLTDQIKSRDYIIMKNYFKLKHQGNRRNYRKAPDEATKSKRRITRRNLRMSRQILAAHYGADSSMFSEEDEHTGNGRARHSEGVFKAWRSSDWMEDFGMDRHFVLANDGRLTVHESGLYLVYAQIHYLDEHDENGFHLLVNGHPILQCMVYSPGVEHKSRSCFSAQVTLLESGDRIVLKDIGVSRYTLFQKEKSFFGLIKLGDIKQQQQQLQLQTTSETTVI